MAFKKMGYGQATVNQASEVTHNDRAREGTQEAVVNAVERTKYKDK